MQLADYFRDSDIAAINRYGSISFHALGDSGVGTNAQLQVAEAMTAEIDTKHSEKCPAFLLHLGDILYGQFKSTGYVNKFYRPYSAYDNYIFGIPGNHDGEIRDNPADSPSLAAFLENFCQPIGGVPPQAGDFNTKMPHHPGAYWRLTCPFVDIIGLYSNVDENVGVIDDEQAKWLTTILKAIATERASGNTRALFFAVHHPPYAAGLHDAVGHSHPGSESMLATIDHCCNDANVWPNAVLSAHSHNYQSYLRKWKNGSHDWTIPYLIAGGGGISAQPVQPGGTIKSFPDGSTVEYLGGEQSYGYLTITVTDDGFTTRFNSVDEETVTATEVLSFDLQGNRR